MEHTPENTVFEDWLEIESYFSTGRAMLPNKSWSSWISTRAGAGRLSKVLGKPGAGRLAAKLDQLDDERIKALRTVAALNFEQASYGFRTTVIANVTAPVLVLTLVSQMTSGSLGANVIEIYRKAGGLLFIAVMTLFACLALAFMIAYALAALNQARDIRHLIDLHAAERGIYFGLEDAGDLHSP